MTTEPSTEQQAILAASGNLIVEACPGSGKTTTLAMLCRTLPQNGTRHLALAFGKANAEDFKKKLPYWIESGTCHSVCKAAIDGSWSVKPKVTPDKIRYLMKENFPEIPWTARQDMGRLVSLMKQQPQWEFTEEEVESLADMQGITCESACYSQAVRVLKASDQDRTRIDFDDMLRFAALDEGVRFATFATVMVDEAQDTNGIQHRVLAKLRNASAGCAQFIFVGDPNQAIYAFRGADARAMESLREEFDCATLLLSVSWRCSQEVVREANKVLGQDVIQHAPTAPAGCVNLTGRPETGSAILCRNNAPLVAFAFKLLRAGIPVRILGRDLGQGLLKVVEKANVGSLTQLRDTIDAWKTCETRKCKTGKQLDALEDKHKCLLALLHGTTSVQDFKNKIETLFVADTGGTPCVTLATGHKAKGKEWNDVFILDRQLMPSKWATQAWEKVQEKNLHFVMVTRAKLNLTYITS